MKPKIVQITALDTTMKNLIGLLNKRTYEQGYEVHCICSNGDDVTALEELGYIVHPVNIDRKISPLSNIRTIYNIFRILRTVKPDIVHVHTPVASVLGRIAAKLAGVKNIIYTAHGFYFHEGMDKLKYKIFFNIEKYVGRYFTDFIFTQSYEDFLLAKESNFLNSRNRDNYLHISNGIDLNYRFNVQKYDVNLKDEIREELGICKDRVVISFIGRLVREKGVIDLLEAIKLLKNNQKVAVVLMGGLSGSERDQTLMNIKDVYSEENIHFLGRVPNVERYLYLSDIFILPSYREGMPRSIIEAMAMKNAIIATDIRGSREEVEDGLNGYLVSVSSPEELAQKIDSLIVDKQILSRMEEHSYSLAHEKYNEETVVERQLEVFSKVVS